MKFKRSLVAGAFAASLVAVSAVPAYAYDAAYGYRSCTGVKSVSVYGTQSGDGAHYYVANNRIKQIWGPDEYSYYYAQTYSSLSATDWELHVGLSFQPGTTRGGTCI